jgi:predicted Zn-dependent protease
VAKKNQPDNPTIADTLGWVYYKLGNYVLARDQVQFAAAKNPHHPVVEYHLAMIYLKTKQVSEAQRALEKALHSREDFKERAQVETALAELKR